MTEKRKGNGNAKSMNSEAIRKQMNACFEGTGVYFPSDADGRVESNSLSQGDARAVSAILGTLEKMGIASPLEWKEGGKPVLALKSGVTAAEMKRFAHFTPAIQAVFQEEGGEKRALERCYAMREELFANDQRIWDRLLKDQATLTLGFRKMDKEHTITAPEDIEDPCQDHKMHFIEGGYCMTRKEQDLIAKIGRTCKDFMRQEKITLENSLYFGGADTDRDGKLSDFELGAAALAATMKPCFPPGRGAFLHDNWPDALMSSPDFASLKTRLPELREIARHIVGDNTWGHDVFGETEGETVNETFVKFRTLRNEDYPALRKKAGAAKE